MQTTSQGIAAYRAALRTIPPLVAIVRLYDRAIVHMSDAADAARRGDYEAQFDEVSRAARIFNGLNAALDMTSGGSVALSLRDMYGTVVHALFRSVGRPETAGAFATLIAGVRQVRDAWIEVAAQPASAVPPTRRSASRSEVA